MGELEDITLLLKAAGAGGKRAMDEVFTSVYPRLRHLARSGRQNLPGHPTLNTTALVHEAYLKVAGSPNSPFKDRGHFFAGAAKAMRHVLINYAEERSAQKRGGGAPNAELDETGASVDP